MSVDLVLDYPANKAAGLVKRGKPRRLHRADCTAPGSLLLVCLACGSRARRSAVSALGSMSIRELFVPSGCKSHPL